MIAIGLHFKSGKSIIINTENEEQALNLARLYQSSSDMSSRDAYGRFVIDMNEIEYIEFPFINILDPLRKE